MNTAACEGVPFSVNLVPIAYLLFAITAASIILALFMKRFETKVKQQ